MNSLDQKEKKDTQKLADDLLLVIKTSSDSFEVLLATVKLSNILFEQKLYQEAKTIIKKQLTDLVELKSNPLYLEILSTMIKCEIALKNKEEATYYINLKKQMLPQINFYEHYLDLLAFKKAFKEEFFSILPELETYIFNKNEAMEYYLDWFNYLMIHHKDEVDKAYLALLELKPDKANLSVIKTMYFNFLLAEKYFKKLEEVINSEQVIEKIYYQILMLIKANQYKKVQIKEVEFEKDFINLSLSKQQNLYQNLKTFYDQHKDIRSFELYNNKLLSVQKELKKLEKEKKVVKTISFKEEKLQPEKAPPLTLKQKPLTSESLILLEQFFQEVSLLSLRLSLREKLRNIGIILEKHFLFSDMLFYLKPDLFHYKKGRLYQKVYDQYHLNNSLLGRASENYIDIVKTKEEILDDYDILTLDFFSKTNIQQIYCYGLGKGESVCFYQRKKENIDLWNGYFKVISSFVAYKLKYERFITNYKKHSSMAAEMFDSDLAIQFIAQNELVGNNLFYQTFDLKKQDSLASLILKFLPNEQIRYNELLQALKRKEQESFQIELTYNKRQYLAIHHNNKDIIYGLFIDITNQKRELEKWQEKAFVNPISQIATLYEFETRFASLSKSKQTFLLIELGDLDYLESLYGKALKNKFFLEFVEFCQKYFTQLYQFDQTSVLATVNKNDIRTIKKLVQSFYNQLQGFKSNIIPSQNLKVYTGIIRYPIQTKETNTDKIYQYLSIALYKAKTSSLVSGYYFFNYDDYLQDNFETEMIRQIDRLITNKNLELTFTQILNQNTNKVYAYEVGISNKSLNIYADYYYQVAQKRGFIEELEKYILEKGFKTLNQIYKKTSKYVKLSFQISNQTASSITFIPFLLSLYQRYEIPLEAVEIILELNEKRQSNYKLINDLNSLGVILGTNNLAFLKEPAITVFHLTERRNQTDEKTLAYLNAINEFCLKYNMRLILYHVNNAKEKALTSTLKLDYIRGKMVDKTFSLDELLKIIKGY